MPREVFAEEIEAFLERLEDVASARVVANEAGEVDRIYVTSESARDDGAIRRAVGAALISQFNLVLDGWRVQIAHLEPISTCEPLPSCQLARLEETVTDSYTRVRIELRYERGGAQKSSVGSFQAPPGHAHRLRTVALAAVEAARPLLARSGYRPSLEALTQMPFAGTTVVLAAVSLISERASVLHVGTSTVTGSEAEAVVAAVLDAASRQVRPPAQTGRMKADRRKQFDSLRRHYERLIRTGPPDRRAAPPDLGSGVQTAGVETEEVVEAGGVVEAEEITAEELLETEYGEEEVAASGEAEPPTGPAWTPEVVVPTEEAPPEPCPQAGTPPVPNAADVPERSYEYPLPAAHPDTALAPTVEDLIRDISDIRPEAQGGAPPVTREEIRHEPAAPGRQVPRGSFEDAFYRRLVATGVPVHIRCRDGYEIPTAVLKEYGTYTLVIEVGGVAELVFKHAVISIRPYSALPPETEPTA